MIIEIRKAGFVNKGAELMLHATLTKMRGAYPEAKFAMVPSVNRGAAPFEKRAALGLLQKAWVRRYRIQWGDLLGTLTPPKTREMFGVVLDREVDIVLDAAGFAYSDQWGSNSSEELAKSCKRWRKNGTKVVLLPQAFGPFTSQKIKDAIRVVADNTDLIFARDRISYEHLVGITGKRLHIKMAPDFTNLTEGILPADFDSERNRFCIVPNFRMIDKTPKDQSEAYLPFLIKCTKYLSAKGMNPFVLVHGGADDLMLAQKIRDAVGEGLPIIKESHPLKVKGILGVCEGTIGSRFHGLVSALSQGIPSLASGWSHKYQMLFEDYGFQDGLMSVTMSEEEVQQKIDLITESPSKDSIKDILNTKARELKQKSLEMWDDVFLLMN